MERKGKGERKKGAIRKLLEKGIALSAPARAQMFGLWIE